MFQKNTFICLPFFSIF